MRLLIVSTWLPYPQDNGSRVRAFQLLERLAHRHRLTLLAFGLVRAADDLAPLRALCEVVHVVPPIWSTRNRLGVRGLLAPMPRYYVQTESPEMQALVAAHLRRNDVAIGFQIDAARYLYGRAEIPRVFEEAEVAVFAERGRLETNPLRRWRLNMTWWKHRRFVRRLVDEFERTTVVSEQERQYLRAIGCDSGRIVVVPNGIVSPPRLTPPERVARLVYAGSVTYSANLDAVRYFVRDVFPLIRPRRPEVVLCVTGATEGVDVSDLAGIDGVVFTGRLPEVDSIVAGSAVCVVPLRIGGGTRLKVLQAMALGTPVVSTSKGIEGLDASPGQHVLVADTPQAFADQVLRVLEDEELGRRIAGAARRLAVERYSWGPIGETLERVIEGARHEYQVRRETAT